MKIRKGRISRMRFILGLLLIYIAVRVVKVSFGLIGAKLGLSLTFYISLIPQIVNLIALFFYCWIMIKRSHDINKSGSYIIPIIGLVVSLGALFISLAAKGLSGMGSNAATDLKLNTLLLVTGVTTIVLLVIGIPRIIKLLFIKGTVGTNEYGPDPLAASESNAK